MTVTVKLVTFAAATLFVQTHEEFRSSLSGNAKVISALAALRLDLAAGLENLDCLSDSHEGSHELVVMRVVETDVEDGLQLYSSVITDTRSYTTGAPPAGSKPRWVTKYRFRI